MLVFGINDYFGRVQEKTGSHYNTSALGRQDR